MFYMTSVNIEFYDPTHRKELIGSELAFFWFSDGGVASCYHNEEHMVAECYYDRIDPKKIQIPSESYDIWEELEGSKVSVKDFPKTNYITEDIINYILNWMCTDELVSVNEYHFDE